MPFLLVPARSIVPGDLIYLDTARTVPIVASDTFYLSGLHFIRWGPEADECCVVRQDFVVPVIRRQTHDRALLRVV